MTKNMINVLFILGIMILGYTIFGGIGMMIGLLVCLIKGDKKEK